ncbi:MAG: S9 family peptidase [Phycisphaerae bacterium]|nr:S9 family peptidase [Phycisphaerae bacterium]
MSQPRKPSSPPSRRRTLAAKRRPIEAEDLLCLVSVGDPQISADGTRLLFVRSVINDRQKAEASIWTAATDGSTPPRALTHGPKDSMARFAPDGRRVAFLRGADGKATQIAMLDLAGGEARTLTNLPEGSIRAMHWSPDGTRLAVTFRPTEADWTIEAKNARERDGRGDPPRVLDDRWNRLDGDGWFGAARYALHLVDASSGSTTLLYAEDTLGDFDMAWSPNSARLAITTNRANDALLKPWKSELMLVDVARGTASPIGGLPIGPKLGVAWSPDGARLAWAGRIGRDSAYSTENLELWTMTVPGASAKRGHKPSAAAGSSDARSLTHATDLCLLAPTLSDSSEVAFKPTIVWQDNRTVLTRVGWYGGGHLVAVSLDSTAPRFLTEGLVEHVIGNVARDGARVAALRSDPTTPAEAGTLELGQRGKTAGARWRPATAFNAAFVERLDLVAPSEHWVTADDGHRTQVWVIRPPKSAPRAARSRGQRGPAVLEIHGGPHTQYGAGFFHEFHLLAAQGYVVFYPNPRGSKGYGRDHCDPIRGSWGDKDWLDVQAVTRFIQSMKDIDPKRIGIMGGSYGGYMTNWAIAHSKAYCAAITDRCVSNMLSFAGNSDYPLVPGEYWTGTNYDNPERLWKSSPIAHFKGVSAPTLIIHSEGDLRCNIEQGEQVHTALVLQGVPTRFVRYPLSTSHGMSRSGPPDMKLHRLREIIGWWKKWL